MSAKAIYKTTPFEERLCEIMHMSIEEYSAFSETAPTIEMPAYNEWLLDVTANNPQIDRLALAVCIAGYTIGADDKENTVIYDHMEKAVKAGEIEDALGAYADVAHDRGYHDERGGLLLVDCARHLMVAGQYYKALEIINQHAGAVIGEKATAEIDSLVWDVALKWPDAEGGAVGQCFAMSCLAMHIGNSKPDLTNLLAEIDEVVTPNITQTRKWKERLAELRP